MRKGFTFFQCIKLRENCINNGVLATDPTDKNRVLVYRDAGTGMPEGWYSEPLMHVARELLHQTKGQELLTNELEKRGVTFTCAENPEYPVPFVHI